MVGGHQALLLIAPFKEREVDNPQALEHILVAQSEAVAHLKAQGAKLYAGLVGIVATHDKHQVAVLGTHLRLNGGKLVGRIELVDGALHCAVGIILDVDQALGSYLRLLDKVGQLVELLARVAGASGHADGSYILGIVEDGEGARALEFVHQLHKGHAEAQVGFVGAIEAHGLMPCHTLQGRKLHAADFLEQVAGHILKDLKHVVLVHEAHLAVYLGELRLAVGPQVLVAEALGYLEVAVEARHHQQLFQSLRTLGQGIELAGIHSRRHHEVARAFGSGANEDWGLHLDEVLRVEEVANQNGHPVAQFQVFPHHRPTEVKIAVFHSQVVATVGLVLYLEGRGQRGTEDIQLGDENLYLACGNLAVLTLALAHLAPHLDTIFTSKGIGSVAKGFV